MGKQGQTRLIAATIDAVVHFLSRAVWGANTVRWLQSEVDAWIRSLPSSRAGAPASRWAAAVINMLPPKAHAQPSCGIGTGRHTALDGNGRAGGHLPKGHRAARKTGENQVRARSGALYAGCRLHNRTDPTSEKVEPSCRASSGDVSAWQASDPSWRKSHLYNQPAAITGRRGPLWIAPTWGS
jgi:hypothetical protein